MNIVYIKEFPKLKSTVPLRDLKTKAHRWKKSSVLKGFPLDRLQREST